MHGSFDEHLPSARIIDEQDWQARGRELYGPIHNWKFRCPSCGHVQTVGHEMKRRNWITYSCEGRYVEGVGCDWTLGGFLRIHETEIRRPDGSLTPVFEFAAE